MNFDAALTDAQPQTEQKKRRNRTNLDIFLRHRPHQMELQTGRSSSRHSVGSGRFRCCHKKRVEGAQPCRQCAQVVFCLIVSLEERFEEVVFRHRQGFRPHRHRFHVSLERFGLLDDILVTCLGIGGFIAFLIVFVLCFLLACVCCGASMAS